METNIAKRGWSTWPLQAKLSVSIGIALAIALVVFFYLPR